MRESGIEERLRLGLLRGLDGDARAYREFLYALGGHLRAFLRRRLTRLPDEVEDLLGADTPLGRAIRAKFEGDEIDYAMGDVRRVRIAQVTPGQAAEAKTIADQAQARRDAVLTKARSAAERTNAEMFAASFSGKWGDYDIDPPGQVEEDRI